MTELLGCLHLDAVAAEYALGDADGIATALVEQSVGLARGAVSTWSVFVSGSQTTWFMPTLSPPGFAPGRKLSRAIRKTFSLLTLVGSMGESKGIETRVCSPNPSRVLMTFRSSQYETCTLQSGYGRFTRRPVFWFASGTVNRSLGNGPASGFERSNRATTRGESSSLCCFP